MIRTYEIDLDDKLVEDSGKIFESLGSDIDSAIKIFLTQSVLRKGFPFEIAVPAGTSGEIKKENMIENEALQAISWKNTFDENNHGEKQNDALSKNEVKNQNNASEIPDFVKIAELKKDLSELENPEQSEISGGGKQKTQAHDSCDSEAVSEPKSQNSEAENSEDEDETAPENLFAQWTFGSAENNGNSAL